MIGEPPVDAGADQERSILLSSTVAARLVGAPGTSAGVTEPLVPDGELVPIALVAVTVKVYAVPFVRPVTVAVVAPDVVAVNPPLLEVTVYPVMAEPPLKAGADHVTLALLLPAEPATFVGASGTVAGVAELLAVEAVLVPFAFVAVTVKVYAVPLVRPVTVIGDEPPVAVIPVFEVTVYEVMAEPPLLLGAVKVIVAEPVPAVATMLVGASGIVDGTMELLVPDGVLVPTELVAVTVKVYVVPFVRPVMVIGDEPPVAVKPPVFELTV